jgi:hypothetical protein
LVPWLPDDVSVHDAVTPDRSTRRKRVVQRYIDGFRAGDHEMILAGLTDDVTWEMPPYFRVSGKTAFH